MAPVEIFVPSAPRVSSSQFAQELSKNADLLDRKLAATLSDQPLPLKEGISDPDFELHIKCNVVIAEVVQLLKGLYNCEAFQDPPILAQLRETERELARVKKIVETVENEKNKMKVFIKSAACREAMSERKCDNQQGLIRVACVDLKESKKKVADLRVANLGLVRSLEEAKLELSIVQNRVFALSNYVLALRQGECLDSIMHCAIELYFKNSKQRHEQKGPVMNALQKFEREAQRMQYRLFLQQGLLKGNDPEMKRTLDSWYEVSSTKESDVASSSSDEGYEVESLE